MVSAQVIIKNATGLHARPASNFVMAAKRFDSRVSLKRVGSKHRPVNAKSIMSVLVANIPSGAAVEIRCDGTDEDAALATLVSLAESGFETTGMAKGVHIRRRGATRTSRLEA